MPFRKSFTDEMDAELKRRVADGEPYSLIAKEMGLGTRNAAIGRAFRLGLTATKRIRPAQYNKGGTNPALALYNRQRRSEARLKQSTITGQFSEWKSSPRPPLPVLDEMGNFAGAKNIPIDELREGVCHWPMWGKDRKPYDFDAMVYCGCGAEKDLPYCGYHCSVAYVPAGKVNTYRVPLAG